MITKKIFSNDLPIGEKIERVPFMLKNIKKVKNDYGVFYDCIFEDVKGICYGNVLEMNFLSEYIMYVDDIVLVSGFVTYKRERIEITVSKMEKVEDGGSIRAEWVIKGISEQDKQKYISIINEYLAKIKSASYKEIINCIYNTQFIDEISKLPYSKYQDNYEGAALEFVGMMLNLASAYVAGYNSLRASVYEVADKVNEELIYTAILLSVCGHPYLYEKEYPHLETKRYILEGSFNTVWHIITYYARKSEIPSADISILCSVLCSLYQTNENKSVNKEGIILFYLSKIIKECNKYDSVIANMISTNTISNGGMTYSSQLRRYIAINDERREV